MSATRSFLRDHAVSDPTSGRTAYATDPPTGGEQAEFGCHVLARIPEAITPPTRPRRRSPDEDPHVSTAPNAKTTGNRSETVYRVDPPQSCAPHRNQSASAAEPVRRPPYLVTPHSSDDLAQLPLLIRLAVDTWQFLQPYQPQIRMAALFALVAAGGMSMALMIGGTLEPHGAPVIRGSVAVEQSTGHEDVGATQPVAPAAKSAVDLQPAWHTTGDPEASTTSDAPTAIGPIGAADRPSFGPITGPQVIAPGNPPTARPRMQSVADDTAAAPAAPAYPSTSYPTFAPPEQSFDQLPQARAAEPPRAMARLQGHIEEVQSR